MDSYRSRQYSHPTRSPLNHPSSVSPGSQASPHTTMKGGNQNSPLMPTFGRSYSTSQGLDRILQSPHDAYGRSSLPNQDGYGRSSVNDESSRGYGDAEYGSGGIQQGYSTSGHGGGDGHGGQAGGANFTTSGPTAKRGSKACVACRKGKNRCQGDPSGSNQSCRRCLMNGIPCVFEKATERTGRARNGSVGAEGFSGEAEGRVSNLERSVQDLAQGQDQIQIALQQVLSMLPRKNASIPTPTSLPFSISHPNTDGYTGVSTANIFHHSVSPPSIFANASPSLASGQRMMYTPKSPQTIASGRLQDGQEGEGGRSHKRSFPKLPGFAPPNHTFGTYGIIPLSSAPGSPNHSRHSSLSSSRSATSSAIPQDSLTAPIQALQTLANAADQAAASREAENGEERERNKKRKRVTIDGKSIHLRVRRKTKPDPTPRNPFPDVVTKGLVSETEARELWDIFFSGCHYFVPLWDKSYDTYETYIERTPFSTNGLLAVAAKIRAGNGPVGQTFHRCLEEAQGIARSTLFGPIVRKEAVMAMLTLSVWSQNGWLPCGHALRGGLDMNLHRALDKLADGAELRNEAEERDLVVSARIWLNCYMHDHLVSLGTGKPLALRDGSSVKHARILLSHPMSSETDMHLIAGIELVNLRVRVVEHLAPLHGKVDTQSISFVKRMFADLQEWYLEWYGIHRTRHDDESVLVKLLEAELVYAQMWTVCVALRGCQWDKLTPDQRELAFQAKDAAMRCLKIFMRSPNFRAHLKYATHDQLVSVTFAAVFLLKIAILYPSAIPLPTLISQVSELAHLLSAECFAERYALTLRLMLANFRRKTGALSTVPGTPRLISSHAADTLPTQPGLGNHAVGDFDGGLQSLLSLPQMGEGYEIGGDGSWNAIGEEVGGFAWPTELSPSDLPVWLQDGNFTDLGLPADGSDSLFLPPELASMFLPRGTTSNAGYQFALPDSGDVGAEAW